MGLVVFSVRGSGQGHLEVHQPCGEALVELLSQEGQSKGCRLGFQRQILAGGWPELALLGISSCHCPTAQSSLDYLPLGTISQSGPPACF